MSRRTHPKNDHPDFRRWLVAQNAGEASIRTYISGVRRILANVPDLTEENLTEYLYSCATGSRANLRLSWKLYAQALAANGTKVPLIGYRGKGKAIVASLKAASGEGLRRYHNRRRAEKAEKNNPRYGRIMLATTDGTTFVGDVVEQPGRILLDRAVIVQAEGGLAKLPGRVSVPSAREAYRVLVANNAYLPG